MLDQRLLRDNAPEYVGTVRINHDECPAGPDTRRRLYVTRKVDGKTILGYCHNCQQAGVTSEVDKLIFGGPVAARETQHKQETELPDTDPIHFNKEAMSWLAQYGVRVEDYESLQFGVDMDQGRLIMPVWETIVKGYGQDRYAPTGLLGYQSRRLGTYNTGPKYLTAKFSGTTELETTFKTDDAGLIDCVVLVEDLVSAIKVSRSARYVVPMYGCHLRSERILELSRRAKVIVWLDNDNPTVIKQANRIHNLVQAFGEQSSMVTGHRDPKLYTQGLIQQVLKERLND